MDKEELLFQLQSIKEILERSKKVMKTKLLENEELKRYLMKRFNFNEKRAEEELKRLNNLKKGGNENGL